MIKATALLCNMGVLTETPLHMGKFCSRPFGRRQGLKENFFQ